MTRVLIRTEQSLRFRLEESEKKHSHLNPKTAELREDLFEKLKQKRKHLEAEQLCKKNLGQIEENYGQKSIECVAGFKLLKRFYHRRSLYYESEKYCQKALTIIGPEHPDYEDFLRSLATIYRLGDKFEQAENLYRQILILKETKSDSCDLENYTFNLVDWLYEMADFYGANGCYEKAKQCLIRAMEILEENPFYIIPDTSYVLLTLADLYTAWGKYQKAEFLAKRALKKSRALHGAVPGIPKLAVIYALQGQYQKAENILDRFITQNARNKWTIGALINLATVFELQGKEEAAADKLRDMFYSSDVILSYGSGLKYFYYDYKTIDNLWSNISALEDLADLYVTRKILVGAEFLYTFALSLHEALIGMFGSSEHNIVERLENLARFYQIVKKLPTAILFQEEKKRILERSFGSSHPILNEVQRDIDRLEKGEVDPNCISFPRPRFHCGIMDWIYVV